MSQRNAFAAYVGIARVQFLLLPVTLIANGAAAQAWAGEFSWSRTLLALLGLLAVHAAVNVHNDLSDYETGIDLATVRTPFSGGSGILPAGALTTTQARGFFYGCMAVGAAVTVALVAQVGWGLIPIVLAGAVMIVCYTPVMTRTAVGEIAAGLGLGLLPVIGTAMAQEGHVSAAAIAAGVPGFFMTFDLLLLNEFPDEIADRAGGRLNLVLLLGRRGASRLFLIAAALGSASIAASVALGLLPWPCLFAILPVVALAPAARWARTPGEAPPIPAMAGNVVWNLFTNLLLAAGFVVARVL